MKPCTLLLLCGILISEAATLKDSFQRQHRGKNAFEIIHAEQFDENNGCQIQDTCGSNMQDVDCNYLSDIDNGDITRYDDIDFGNGAASVKFALACGNPITAGSSKIEIRLDDLNSTTVIAPITIGYTGGWSEWIVLETFLTFPVMGGIHDVYFTYVRDCQTFNCEDETYNKVANIDWFMFYGVGV